MLGWLGCCEVDKKLEAAKLAEENSYQLVSEQLGVIENLLQETARLKRELVEAGAQCVICRDSKPSRAFVPCGHVCLCSSCWDSFERNGGGRCLYFLMVFVANNLQIACK